MNQLSKELESIDINKIYEQLNDIESLYELDYDGIIELLEKIKQNLHLFNFDQLIPLLSRFMHEQITECGLEVSFDSIILIAEIFGKTHDKRVLADLQFLYNWEPSLYGIGIPVYDPNQDPLSSFRLAAVKAAIQLIDVGGKDIILGAVDDRHFIVYKTAAKACAKFKLKEAIPILLADRYNIYGTRDHEEKSFFDNILVQLDFPIDDKVTRFICDLIYDEDFSYNLFELSDDITLPDFDVKLIIKLFKQYIEIDILNRTYFGESDLLKEYDYILTAFKYYKLTEIVKEEDIVKLFTKDTERKKAINLLKLVKEKKIEEN